MDRSMISPRKENPAQPAPAEAVVSAPIADPAGAAGRMQGADSLISRLARARTANEITNVIGLKPIKGRSGPKVAY